MKERKPWFRASKNAWYVEVNGKQIRLAAGEENRQPALKAFYKLMAGEPGSAPSDGLIVVTLCDLFLDFSLKTHTHESYQHYRHFLQDFCHAVGKLPASDVKPFHVTRWLDSHRNWKGARRSAVISVKRAFSWAEQEGLIAANPIKHVKKPPVG